MRNILFGVMLASMPIAAQSEKPIFACSFGTKQVSIAEDNGAVVYRFGSASKADLELRIPKAVVQHHYELFPHAAHRDVAIPSGEFRYVVASRFATPDYHGEGAEDVQGLLVMRGDRVLSRRVCRSGDGFSDYDFDGLTAADADLTEAFDGVR